MPITRFGLYLKGGGGVSHAGMCVYLSDVDSIAVVRINEAQVGNS